MLKYVHSTKHVFNACVAIIIFSDLEVARKPAITVIYNAPVVCTSNLVQVLTCGIHFALQFYTFRQMMTDLIKITSLFTTTNRT